MSLIFVFDPVLNDIVKDVCREYWLYSSPNNYIAHVETLCQSYGISHSVLFSTLAKCQVYLDDIHCEYCGHPYELDVPADIPYARRLESWLCEGCIIFSGGQINV
ncbi:hypothetical protein [Psychrobacter jeotgali]|uniref:hypothetical protein n=1 Tax=Psychrobacter jeotgali TaxID=179010 RepID=UPI001917A7B3|nr:hypothetical protein [Psychrobacter jeotgali]